MVTKTRPQPKPFPEKIQAKPLEQLLVPQTLVQHPEQKLQEQTLEQTILVRILLIVRLRTIQATLEPLTIQELPVILATLEPRRIRTVIKREPASRPVMSQKAAVLLRRFLMNAPCTASTAPAKVLMIQDKMTIQVSTMTQVSTETSHN